MKNSDNTFRESHEGTGYLLGSLFTFIVGVIVFIISHSIVVAISAAIPTGTTAGIILEQKLKKNEKTFDTRFRGIMLMLFLTGLLIFIALTIF